MSGYVLQELTFMFLIFLFMSGCLLRVAKYEQLYMLIKYIQRAVCLQHVCIVLRTYQEIQIVVQRQRSAPPHQSTEPQSLLRVWTQSPDFVAQWRTQHPGHPWTDVEVRYVDVAQFSFLDKFLKLLQTF